jgi:RsiW-degrading membrane proteinase PrsW (M82 family)
MWQEMWLYLQSWFQYPGIEWFKVLIGIGLALGFTAFWLVGHWPPLFKKYWLWGVAVFSAFFTVLAVVFIQLTVQIWIENTAAEIWYPGNSWWLLITLPYLLTRGLVQEGAKIVPMIVWWWRSDRLITPGMAMSVGAVSGAGFGIFEAVRVHLQTLGAGWTWEIYRAVGFEAIAGFWDAFFTVGFHIALSALIGYGLARGKGWQFYLIGAVVHLAYNYRRALLQAGNITIFQTEIYAAAFTLVLTALVLLWFKHRGGIEAEAAGETINENKLDSNGT